MRQAKSYSIVDHALLHGGYLEKLSHAALALYLFLVVVGDREGRSFYGDASIGKILRVAIPALAQARTELVSSRLIRYQRPYWWVSTLTGVFGRAQRTVTPKVRSSAEPVPIRGVIPEALKNLLQTLEERP